MVIQQNSGGKGLTVYVKDGMIKSNFDISGTVQCGWPGGCAGTYPSGVSAQKHFNTPTDVLCEIQPDLYPGTKTDTPPFLCSTWQC
jgi:hypothetical protein